MTGKRAQWLFSLGLISERFRPFNMHESAVFEGGQVLIPNGLNENITRHLGGVALERELMGYS